MPAVSKIQPGDSRTGRQKHYWSAVLVDTLWVRNLESKVKYITMAPEFLVVKH